MEYETLLVEARGPGLFVTINRPDARNAINTIVMRELNHALTGARNEAEVKVVVITGAGDKAFCAGGDVGGGGSMSAGPVGMHLDRAIFGELLQSMRKLGKPVVARVNGHALGGGLGIALACDIVIAAEHAEFGTPEINIGLWPYVITALILRDMPQKIALEMMMLGRRYPAAELARWGTINRVVPGDELDKAVSETVDELASKSPLILKLGKDSWYTAQDMEFAKSLAYLEDQLSIGLQAEDALEGIQAFLQKRPPEWKGR